MRAILGLLLGLFIAGCGPARAADEDTFLKVNAIYYLWANAGAPSPFQDSTSGKGSTATVKILQHGANQWYWVEFDVYQIPNDKTLPVTVLKKRHWLNFAQVVSLEPGDEINYAATFPQGCKIVPYDGTGP